MIDYRPLLFILGILLTTISVVMILPAIVDGALGNPDWQVFASSSVITLFL